MYVCVIVCAITERFVRFQWQGRNGESCVRPRLHVP